MRHISLQMATGAGKDTLLEMGLDQIAWLSVRRGRTCLFASWGEAQARESGRLGENKRHLERWFQRHQVFDQPA